MSISNEMVSESTIDIFYHISESYIAILTNITLKSLKNTQTSKYNSALIVLESIEEYIDFTNLTLTNCSFVYGKALIV